MTYRVITSDGLNDVSSKRGDGYASMVESALNTMEEQGYLLQFIEPPAEGTTDSYFIFRKVDYPNR